MTTRPCLDCGKLTTHGTRCPHCNTKRVAARDQRRGNANTRGYTRGWRTSSRGVWQGQRCTYCGARAEGADHITPKARGGTDERTNLTPACTKCNSAKRDR